MAVHEYETENTELKRQAVDVMNGQKQREITF